MGAVRYPDSHLPTPPRKVEKFLGPEDDFPIPVGSIIYCPGCGSALGETKAILYKSLIRKPEIEPLVENWKVGRCPFVCPVCERLIINADGHYTYAVPKPKKDEI